MKQVQTTTMHRQGEKYKLRNSLYRLKQALCLSHKVTNSAKKIPKVQKEHGSCSNNSKYQDIMPTNYNSGTIDKKSKIWHRNLMISETVSDIQDDGSSDTLKNGDHL